MHNQAEERLDKDIAKLAKLIKTGRKVAPFAHRKKHRPNKTTTFRGGALL